MRSCLMLTEISVRQGNISTYECIFLAERDNFVSKTKTQKKYRIQNGSRAGNKWDLHEQKSKKEFLMGGKARQRFDKFITSYKTKWLVVAYTLMEISHKCIKNWENRRQKSIRMLMWPKEEHRGDLERMWKTFAKIFQKLLQLVPGQEVEKLFMSSLIHW